MVIIKFPFVFATNGRPYLKQIEAASGIWFRDLRSSLNYPVALRRFKSPEGLKIIAIRHRKSK